MAQDSFRNRIEREAENFDTIYEAFVAEHKDRLERGTAESPWPSVFEMPLRPREMLPDLVADPSLDANDELLRASYDAVVRTVRALKLHERHTGAITSSDPRLSDLSFLGLDIEDLRPQYTLTKKEQTRRGLVPITRSHPDYSDPFFWRTLLEIFCRVFISSAHGARPWSRKSKAQLALDMIEIQHGKLDGKWNADKVRKILNNEPYRSKYLSGNDSPERGVIGEDRIRELTNLIGPMDDKAPIRLYKLFLDECRAILHEETRPENVERIQELLEMGGLARRPD